MHVDPEKELGALAQARPKKLQAHVKKQPAATQKEIQKVFGISHTWSGGDGDHRLYRESGRLPRGRGSGFIKAVAGHNGGNAPGIIAASQQGRLVAPLVFQGCGNTEVVDTYFEQVPQPELPPGRVMLWDNARFHQSQNTQMPEAGNIQGIVTGFRVTINDGVRHDPFL